MPNTEGTGNVFLTDDIIAKEALRLLVNNLIAARFVNRNLERNFGKIGDTISVKKPYRVQAASGRVLQIQPMVDQTTSLTIDTQYHVGLRFTSNDRSLSLDMFSERYLKSGIVQLAHKVDRKILDTMNDQFFNWSGTAGQGTKFGTIIDARAKASLLGWPDDGNIRALLNPLDSASHRKTLATVNSDALVRGAIERAFLGNVAGVDLFETAQMPSFTNGAYAGSGVTSSGGQTGSTLATSGWTSGQATLVKGTIITIADCYAINPQTYASTGQLQEFVVTSTVSDTAGAMNIPISPAINDGSLTTTDGEGNTVSLAAYQNVAAAPGNSKAITVKTGATTTTSRMNFLMHRDAVTMAMIDINLPQTAVVAKRVRDDQSGISMSMTGGYNINDAEETYRIDVLFGVKAIYPELGMRFGGDA